METLCGSSWYNKQYYFNPAFSKIPKDVQDEIQIMCVEFTEDVGGILTIEFGEDGRPRFTVRAAEGDQRFDEIGSELRIKQLQNEKEELMEQLTTFYRIFIKGEGL
ncbi:MAG: DUF6145 family protein [Lachnospiraceae bacterium]|nr:DUF6145 family protein [Lachnospiraceae bacterium]